MEHVQGDTTASLFVADLDTPIGRMQLAATERGLCHVGLPHASGPGLAGFAARYLAHARREHAFAPLRDAARQILEYLEGKRRVFNLPLDCYGTLFQRRVWTALRAIPYGETCSYGELAERLDRPGAARAVGSANGANPLALVIPCHRVVAAGGRIGGYAGGIALKQRLLAMECAALAGERVDTLL